MLIKSVLVAFIFVKLFSQNGAVTHWVVTETGRIQAYMESPYDMRRPYDLLALMEQEKRHEEISSLYNDLIVSKLIIEDKWSSLERTSNLGNKFTSSDPDCLAAGKLFLDIDLFSNIATNGTERRIKIPFNTKYDSIIKNHNPPDCSVHTKYYTGPWPYHEVHPLSLENGIISTPDESLRSFMPIENIKLFGHEINQGLKKNSSSWLHYNLAAIYWRIKGDGPKAVACAQRAIHFVPVEYRDIPVHNLAGMLHHSRYSKEAAMFLHSCVDHAPKESIHHLALGNIYASLGDYNKSVQYYDLYLHLRPNQKDAIANRHAILCYWKLETGLIQLQESLQGILADLHTYHSQQQQWLRLQERLMWEHSSFDVQIEGFQQDAMETPSGNGKKMQRCFQKTSASNKPYISCEDFYNNRPDLDSLNVESLFNYVKMEKRKLNDHIKYAKGLKKNKTTNEKKVAGKTPPILHHKYPTTMVTATTQYYDATGWPSKDECMDWNLPIHQKEDLDIPVYLPPENKGYQVQKILGEYIDLPRGVQHDLPWHPPVCEHPDTDGDKYLPPSEKQALNIQLKSSPFLRQYLINYGDDELSDEAEIGQRIISAMEKKSAPRWVLATLASLYWRVRGNARRALDCLDLAFQIVPKDPTDVVLVSIGSLVYQLGFHEQALKFATLAFKINYIEPSTNFLLALLHYSKHNPLLAMYYMKNVLRVEPDYYDGRAEELLKLWACRVKLGGFTTTKFSSSPDSTAENGMCVKKSGGFKGEGVLCSPNGDQCKTASISCYPTNLAAAEELKKPSCLTNPTPGPGKEKIALGHTLISTLLSSDHGGSGDLEPDQSKLESVTDDPGGNPPHAFHMRLSLGDKHPYQEHARLGDFFVSVALSDDPEQENLLHVYDQFGTYSLSPTGCKNMKVTPDFKYSSVWPSIAARSLDITPYLRSSYDHVVSKLEPYCTEVIPGNMNTLDYIRSAAFKHQLGNAPDEDLAELLGLMASDRRASVEELGFKIAVALDDVSDNYLQHEQSWILAVAASVYWRVVGNSGEALSCLRVALTYVPDDMRDVPLNHMANLLNRVGYHSDALEIAHLALSVYNNFVLNHFTVANIHISMGDLEKSVAFYRACLALDSNFAPARYKLQAVLCSLLFDETPKPPKKSEQD